MENIFTTANLKKFLVNAREIETPKVSRIEQLKNRYEKLLRLRNYSIEDDNIFKKKQADLLVNNITSTLNLITTPKSWN
jgi:competence CoiA-like predicted nuclease